MVEGMKWLVLSFVLACGAPAMRDPVPVADPPALTITASAFGPIRPDTPATLVALRAVLAGYEVRPTQQNGLEYQVFERDRRVFTVVPTSDAAIFNIHVASPRIAVAGHDRWRVGAKFADWQALTQCACWGGKPVCFRVGDHVALAFDRKCGGLRRTLRWLEGLPIEHTIWSPKPFGEDEPRAAEEPDEPED